MHLTASYLDMNQAVPGTLASPLMEPSIDCQVPSPSQWSDPCCSPPSLHSPLHFNTCDLDKLKEEPLSPQSSYPLLRSPQSIYTYSKHLMSREGTGGEASFDLAELLVEREIAQAQVQAQQQQPQTQAQQEYHVSFLEGLVKTEFEDPEAPKVVPVSSPAPTPSTSRNDDDVLCIALDHYRQDFEEASKVLKISRDPSEWSVQDVKSWLHYEATRLHKPIPFFDNWNIPGSSFIQLTEAQFRKLLPNGGNLFYADLEIWKACFKNSSPVEPPRRISPPMSQMQQVFVTQSGVQGSTSFQGQVVSQSSPSFQVSSTMIPTVVPSAPARMTSPGMLPISQIPTTSAIGGNLSPKPTMSLSRSPIGSPPMQVPTSVMDELPKRSGSPNNPIGTPERILHMEDVPTMVPSESVPQTILASSSESILERRDTETSLEDEPASGSSGRGSTHIHLWQFLKELLQKPQEHGACIRWLDRPKGIFKIEDSVRVAKLWGRRKNRPAMNYDKLSRSIRQYYKKGIMKKTERSQRLVYQFCHPYSL